MEKWITSVEAAGILHLTIGRIRQLCRDGKIRARKLGRDWLVDSQSKEFRKRRKQALGVT